MLTPTVNVRNTNFSAHTAVHSNNRFALCFKIVNINNVLENHFAATSAICPGLVYIYAFDVIPCQSSFSQD